MVNFCVWMLESSLLVVMILGIRHLFQGRVRYAGIYALWLVILLRFLIPVQVFSGPLSVGDVVSRRIDAWKQTELSEADGDGAGEQRKSRQSETRTTAGLDAVKFAPEDISGQKSVKIEEGALSAQKTGEAAGVSLWRFLSHTHLKSIMAGMWAVVSLSLLLWFGLSNLFLTRRLRRDRQFYGKRGRVSVYGVAGMRTPCLCGLFRPAIYIPRELLRDSGNAGEELEQIITHEYVHYRHGDHIWAAFRILLISVYWFHPFLWLAVSCSKKDAELFCDETVIGLLGEDKRFCYGEMLVKFAGEARWGDFRYSMMPMSRRGREMERRIRAISGRRRYSRWLLLPLALVVIAAVGMTCSAGVNPDIPGQKLRELEGQADRAEQKKAETVQKNGKKVQDAGAAESEQTLKLYSDFLRERAEEEGGRYYSLAWMDENRPILLLSSAVRRIDGDYWGSSACEMYDIREGAVAFRGRASGDSAQWLRLSQGKLFSRAGETVTSTQIVSGDQELIVDTVERGGGEEKYQAGLKEFQESQGVVFYANPFREDTVPEGVERQAVQDSSAQYLAWSAAPEKTVYSEDYRICFQHYINDFTDAVNTGNTEKLRLVLAEDSEVYRQQCALVKNYYKRGIREKVKSCSIVGVYMASDTSDRVEINSEEKIRVTYRNAKSAAKGKSASQTRMVGQRYRYTCENREGNWVITAMDEIEGE